MSQAPLRVWVFVDGQNVYRDAREAFHVKTDPSSYGQVWPRRLAELLVNKGPQGGSRQLDEVRVYTGEPSSTKQPKANAAHMKQRAAWQKTGLVRIVAVAEHDLAAELVAVVSELGLDVDQLGVELVVLGSVRPGQRLFACHGHPFGVPFLPAG